MWFSRVVLTQTANVAAMTSVTRLVLVCVGLVLVAAAAETHGVDGRTIIAAVLLWAATITQRK